MADKKTGVDIVIGLGPSGKGGEKPAPGGFGAEPEGDDMDPKALAGTALAKALKSGNGATIAAAFEELLAAIDEGSESDDIEEMPAEEIDEPPAF